jgi:Flp pilus assembly protein TadD
VLERIRGRVPERIHDDVEFLRANVYLALGRPAEAVETLERLQDSERLTGFAGYNLGIALLQDEREADAIEELDRAGKVDARDPAIRAIRDKSNLVLGTLLLESTTPRQAQRYLDRVHLDGPYSNQALLRAGWANASADRFDRAVVPWSLLAEREPTDAAVQDVLLALPHAYSKLDLHGRAAVLYEQAARVFGDELQKIDTSIASIREGRFLEALVQEEVRQDANWVIHLRSRRGAPETFYLTGLMASHEFHTALRNYLDLEDLRNRLVAWRTDLDAFEDLIRLRREYYEPLLPEVDRRFRRLDARIRLRLEQREHLAHRLQQMLTAPQPELLATSEEQLARAELRRLESSFEGASDRDRADIQERIERLKGTLDWTLAIDYHRRLMLAHRHLRELGADVQALDARYERFVRVRQAAVHSYVGYGIPIDGLRTRVREALDRLTTLMARQGHALETLATRELTARRERLEDYQNQARFAFADSYDRAAKAQARHE